MKTVYLKRVLIIDDSKESSDLFNDFIKSWGYDTLLAYQGREAIDVAFREKPDLILLDIMLPGMNGFEICRMLKENPETRQIPIIMVTALTSPEDRVNGYIAGTDNFLVKPVNYKELKAIIQNLLKKKQWQDKMEEQDITLDIFYAMLEYFAGGDEEIKEDFTTSYINICKLLELDQGEIDIALQVLRFQPLYEKLLQEHRTKKFMHRGFDKLKFSSWLMPLLQYSSPSNQNKKEEFSKYLEEKGLKKIGDICYTIGCYLQSRRQNEGITEKALKDFLKETRNGDYQDNIVKAVEQEIMDSAIRKSLKLDS